MKVINADKQKLCFCQIGNIKLMSAKSSALINLVFLI